MLRIDKFLHDMNIGTRTQIRKLIRDGQISVNGEAVRSGRVKIDPDQDEVQLSGEVIQYQKHFYFIVNKPIGVLTATEDRKQKTVMDLFNKTDRRSDLFPVGRLDKNTEGLLLITNNGEIGHRLLSPEHHVDKVYEATVTGQIKDSAAAEFADGLTLKDGTRLKPAGLKVKEYSNLEKTTTLEVTISEGKYHQVRRMFGALGERVLRLRRVRFGPLELDVGLLPGHYRALTDEEIVNLENL